MLTLTEPFLRHDLCLLLPFMSFEVPDSKHIKLLSRYQYVDAIIFRRIVL